MSEFTSTGAEQMSWPLMKWISDPWIENSDGTYSLALEELLSFEWFLFNAGIWNLIQPSSTLSLLQSEISRIEWRDFFLEKCRGNGFNLPYKMSALISELVFSDGQSKSWSISLIIFLKKKRNFSVKICKETNAQDTQKGKNQNERKLQ